MKKNTYNLDYVKDEYMKRELAALEKMYPDEDTKEKYILFVKSELWFPYISNDIRADIDFIYDDYIKRYNYKLRTPYPNKTITTISMINGRKVCNLGMPIIFNSYDEIKKLKSILIKWKIDSANNDIEEKFYIQVLYNLNFKYVDGKRIYSLYSKDTSLQSYRDKESLLNYVEEFSDIVLIKNSSKEELSIERLQSKSNKPIDEEAIKEEAFSTLMKNMGMKDFIDTAKNNKKFLLYSYYAEEILEPSTIAESIPH